MKVRLRAFLIHFLLSALVLGVCAVVIFGLWYPPPYYAIQGADRIILVLIGVDLVLGPALTFVVFVPGKKSLKFDLSVIVLLQVLALAYGLMTIYQERPVWMVFALDRFSVVASKEVDAAEARQYGFDRKPWRGPLMVVARLPEDPERRHALTEETLFEGKPDVDRRPEFWRDYAPERKVVMEAAIPLDQLLLNRPGARDAIERLAAGSGLPVPNLRFLPVIGKNADFALVMRPQDGAIVGLVETDPWLAP